MNNLDEIFNYAYGEYKKRFNKEVKLETMTGEKSVMSTLNFIREEYEKIKEEKEIDKSPSSSVCSDLVNMMEVSSEEEEEGESKKECLRSSFNINKGRDAFEIVMSKLKSRTKNNIYQENSGAVSDVSPGTMTFNQSCGISEISYNNLDIEGCFEDIISKKKIRIKEEIFLGDADANEFLNFFGDDEFAKDVLVLMSNKEYFYEEKYTKALKEEYPNRIELNFFEMFKTILLIKKAKLMKRTKLIEHFILSIETLYHLNKSCLGINNFYLLSSKKSFVFKPILLLKLYDNSYEATDIVSYFDLNEILFIKVLVKVGQVKKAFRHVYKLLQSNAFPLACYYFCKVVYMGTFLNVSKSELGKFLEENNYSLVKSIMEAYSRSLKENKEKNVRVIKSTKRLESILSFYNKKQNNI